MGIPLRFFDAALRLVFADLLSRGVEEIPSAVMDRMMPALLPVVAVLAQPGVPRIEILTLLLYSLGALIAALRRTADVARCPTAVTCAQCNGETADRQRQPAVPPAGLGIVRVSMDSAIDFLLARAASRHALTVCTPADTASQNQVPRSNTSRRAGKIVR